MASGEGSDALLTMLANAYLRPGDEVLFSEHDFIVYKIATLANSAKPVEIPDPDLRFDVDAALARVTTRPASCSSPIPTILPALISAMKRCAACMRGCRRTRCW